MAQYQVDFIMTGDDKKYFDIPKGMNFVSIINSTDNRVELYQKVVVESSLSDMLVSASAFQNITVPIRFGWGEQFTVIWTDGSVIADKRVSIIFSTENLNINSQSGGLQGSSTVGIIGDTVGLARQNQLPSSLSAGGGHLRVSVENSPIVEIGDSVGVVNFNGGNLNVKPFGGYGHDYSSAGGMTTQYANTSRLYGIVNLHATNEITLSDTVGTLYKVPGGRDVQFPNPLIFQNAMRFSSTAGTTAYYITDFS